MESVVVWATYDTTILFSPNNLLMRDDLPTLGLPIIDIWIGFFSIGLDLFTPLPEPKDY